MEVSSRTSLHGRDLSMLHLCSGSFANWLFLHYVEKCHWMFLNNVERHIERGYFFAERK